MKKDKSLDEPQWELSALERRTQEIGRQLLAHGRAQRPSVFSTRFWSDQFMGWSMRDPALKVQLFRFVDVFPMLRTSSQIYDYLTEYLGDFGVELPKWLTLGLTAGRMVRPVFAAAVTRQIRALSRNFIAGADPHDALPRLRRLWDEGVASSVDLLGETCVSDLEANVYRQRYLELIETLADQMASWDASPRLERDHLGPIPRANVSVKIGAFSPRVDAIDFDGSIRALLDSLRPVLQTAARRGVLLNFDMEQHAVKDLTIELFCRACEDVGFPAAIALQAYLKTAEFDARRLIAWAKRTGRQVTVRLIKGAYWDHETIQAELQGRPSPVWPTKAETDACFERLTGLLLSAMPRTATEGGVKPALGTHNVRSIAQALAKAEHLDVPPEALEFQMLYGMADQLKAAVVGRGLRLREYAPVGDILPGMAYLVRRLLENTSNESWLRAGFFENVGDDQLLAPPWDGAAPPGASVAGGPPKAADEADFQNEPPRDFADADQRARFASAVWNGEPIRVSPESPPDAVPAAVARAAAAFPAWRDTAPERRAEIVRRAAAELRNRRDELAGVMVREAGKTWREADADICEAIDFCEFYARRAVEMFQPRRLGRRLGELNDLVYQPRGIAAVISPWNFPAAIFTGMTVAGLATGNAAVVKPAEQTPEIAWAICEALWRAGVPRDVLQFLRGGGEIGAALVRHPSVAMIAFTGSKEVGLEILEVAGHVPDQQGHVKKVVCEMGGKNAILVDESADLDEAVLGVRQSAFGYSGQKCSACSRAIVVADVYDAFLARLIEAARALVIGDPMHPGTDLGPVIDRQAAEKIVRAIEVARSEGKIELARDVPADLESRVHKPYVGPHIVSGIRPEHRTAQEEIFGPVLAVMRAADFDQALDWAGRSTFKLTGGLYSRRPSHIERARREFRVGNLYINRGITGALVGRQPFGGFGLSGTGTQAGGPDYLLHFVEPRCITESTLRHGFAPGVG